MSFSPPLNTQDGTIQVAPAQGAVFRVNASLPAPGQVQKDYSGTQALSASPTTIVLETVTTGRTYLITDLDFTISGASGQILVQIQVGGVSVFNGYVNTTKGLECQFETGPIALAGQVVQIVVAASAASTLAYNVYGTEQ
jgi:hypothetical protein